MKPEFRQKMKDLSAQYNIKAIDLIGPLLEELEQHLQENLHFNLA